MLDGGGGVEGSSGWMGISRPQWAEQGEDPGLQTPALSLDRSKWKTEYVSTECWRERELGKKDRKCVCVRARARGALALFTMFTCFLSVSPTKL